MTNTKYYLIANLSRSFENYHKLNEKIHLVGSIFYTRNLDFYGYLSLIKNELVIINLSLNY